MSKRSWTWLVVFLLFFSVRVFPVAGGKNILDAPATEAAIVPSGHPVRALHFVLRKVSVPDALRIVETAQKTGFNTIILSLADAIKLTSFPGRTHENAWSRDDLSTVVRRAHGLGLAVIPEVKLLTHQEKLLGDARPDLMFNNTTYDPRNPQVYSVVFPYIDEIINLTKPPAILIGHDEVSGYLFRNKFGVKRRAHLKKGESPLPADLFLQDVQRIHSYLKRRGIETWMWGDMLISPDEFPSIPGDRALHGTIPGYGKALRAKLPKDIVICDWHYLSKQQDFPTLATFKSEGFRVLGATWKDSKTISDFSRYAAVHGADGVIATTWFHVQRKEWDIVDKIIRESGQAFLRAFPDVR